jgi:hypothetical protein
MKITYDLNENFFPRAHGERGAEAMLASILDDPSFFHKAADKITVTCEAGVAAEVRT